MSGLATYVSKPTPPVLHTCTILYSKFTPSCELKWLETQSQELPESSPHTPFGVQPWLGHFHSRVTSDSLTSHFRCDGRDNEQSYSDRSHHPEEVLFHCFSSVDVNASLHILHQLRTGTAVLEKAGRLR